MNHQTKTITITSPQTTVLLCCLRDHLATCRHHVARLKETGSANTPIAQYWLAQLEAAQQLYELTSKTPFTGTTTAPAGETSI